MADILVVDDDQSMAEAFARVLEHEGHAYTIASNADEALRLTGEIDPDLVIMDIRMPGVDGLQALHQIRARYPDVYVVMMTAYGTSQTSIDAIRAGAFEYLTKPLDLDQLRTVIREAVAARESRRRAQAAAASPPAAAVRLVGDAPAMLEVYKLIGRLAATDVPALVVGERGTGKELVIATIHENSARRDRPFVTVDCATLSEDALAAELFGSQAGTIHLSNVHALARALQPRLARALEEAPRPGAGSLSARVMASTEEHLPALVDAGAFSRELYEALAVLVVRLPPLRERRDDIPILIRHLLQRYETELNRPLRGVDEEVLRRLQEHAWPGNVGELERVLKRACIVTRSDILSMADIGESLSESRLPSRPDLESDLCRAVRLALQERLVDATGRSGSSPFHDIVGLVEGTLVKEALAITGGNQVKASDLLGVNRATLRKKAADD